MKKIVSVLITLHQIRQINQTFFVKVDRMFWIGEYFLHFHVSRACENMVVVEEATATEKSFISCQFSYHLSCTGRVTIVNVVDSAHIIHAAASYKTFIFSKLINICLWNVLILCYLSYSFNEYCMETVWREQDSSSLFSRIYFEKFWQSVVGLSVCSG